jgi:hypothetical protein
MISSTRVQFKALLDYSSGVVDDCDDGGDVDERKPGKISLKAFNKLTNSDMLQKQ